RRPRPQPLSERRHLLGHARLRAALPGRALRRVAADARRAARRYSPGTGPVMIAAAALVLLVAQPAAKPPLKHDVVVDGHHFAVWEKRPAQPRAAILLLHGRTWSSLPNFDLQVPGERRSFMDALADTGLDVYALDMRGYGATPRDATGWLSPARAVTDVAG